MTLSMILLGLWALLLVSKGTPWGGRLQDWLVARPAAALSRVHRGTVFGVAAIAIVALVCWWVIGQEGAVMVSMGLPELTGALAMIDLSVVFDMAVLVIAGAATGGWQVLRTLVQRCARPRAARARRSRPQRKPAANDDGDGGAWLLAA